MAQMRDRDRAYGQKSAFIPLGSTAPKRTKAGAKLAVPRPVNLPSLKKENAANEPAPNSSGPAGWSSGLGGSEPGTGHPDSSIGPTSSLVEKASWAGNGRTALHVHPVAWEQPRALNLREFPSLAAAAAVPQQPTHVQRAASAAAAESGVWDEDERGRGHVESHPFGSERGRSREGGGLGPDAPVGGYGQRRSAQLYHSRSRGSYSPPEDGRPDGDELPSGRYGAQPPQYSGGYHRSGGYGGWHDASRDWQRHERQGPPPPRYARHGPGFHERGVRYGRGMNDVDRGLHDIAPRRSRLYYDHDGDIERRDPSLFPPPPRPEPARVEDCHMGDRHAGHVEPEGPPQPEQLQDGRPSPAARQHMPPPPPPPRKQQQETWRAGDAQVAHGPAIVASEDQTQQPPLSPSAGQPVQELGKPQAAHAALKQVAIAPAAAATSAPLQLEPFEDLEPRQQHQQRQPQPAFPAAAAPAEDVMPDEQRRPVAPALTANTAESFCDALHGQERQSSSAAASQQYLPAAAKPSPPSLQSQRSSAVKPGVSWKALVSGVANEPAQAPPPGQPPAAEPVESADRAAGRRGRSRKEGRRDAGGAGPAAQSSGAAQGPMPGKSQRNKRAARGKKGSGSAADEPQHQSQHVSEPDAASSAASKGQVGRARHRLRHSDASQQPAAPAAAEPFGSEQGAPKAQQPPLATATLGVPAAPAAVAIDATALTEVLLPPCERGPGLQGPAPDAGTTAAASVHLAEAKGPAALVTAHAAGDAGASPSMPAAFGWSSPLADEVAKLQFSASSGHATAPATGLAAPLTSGQLSPHLALLPALGPDLQEPAQFAQPAAERARHGAVLTAADPAHAPPPSDGMADVITSLPADLTLDLGAHAAQPSRLLPNVAAAPPPQPPLDPVMAPPYPSRSPPPPAASPPPFPGGLFPATSSSWQAQPPSKEAVQLFESGAPASAFQFGSIASHQMQFGAVAAAFGQQPQQYGPSRGVDWSSPAPSPPPFVSAGLPSATAFGPASLPTPAQYGHAIQQQQPLPPAPAVPMNGGPMQHHPLSQRPLASSRPQLEDPAAALPDDVFDVPVPQHSAPSLHSSAANGPLQADALAATRSRGASSRSAQRGRGPRYLHQQQQQQQQQQHFQITHAAAFGLPHGPFPPAAYPMPMQGWPSSQAPHFLPPQLVGSRQQQNMSGRGRGRGRSNTGGLRGSAGTSRHQSSRSSAGGAQQPQQ